MLKPTETRPLDSGPLPTLGWALYLGISWTWCIGMFLPVLLVREMGFWGWVVFALPNVVGAGAMGWVLRDAAASLRLTAAHPAACAAFSAVTIVFQVSFVGWIVVALIGHWGGVIFLGAVAGTVVARRRLPRGEMLTAAAAFAASVAAFALAAVWFGGRPDAGFPSPAAGPVSRDLLALAPVCLFGFLLCPYLDLTFHRARAATTPRAGAAAFALGFGGPFLLMIVFTLWYARLLAPLAAGVPADFIPTHLRWLIGGHMAVQTGYTVAVHWNALGWGPRMVSDPAAAGRMTGGLLGFIAGLLPQVAGLFARELSHTGLSRGEIVYRLFLAFYGLVFPAYAWLCMIPVKGGTPEPNRRQLRVLGAVLIAAGPMFWMGFIERRMIWLVPGIGVVLLGRLFLLVRAPVRDRPPTTLTSSS